MKQTTKNKKKLYKNWKLYASVLGALVIATGTGLGIYYGINTNHSEVTKTNLNTLELNTTLPFPVISQQAAFDLFIKSNATITDLKDNIEIVNYTESDYNKLGSLVINAKANSKKYTGTITITIPEKNKTNLNMLISNTRIQGTENMSEKEAFNDFLSANSSFLNLSDFVDYSLYTAATYTSNGSLTITAKTNTAFTGNVKVTIKAIGQTDLNNINQLNTTISIKEDMTSKEAFDTFIENNKDIADLENNIEFETTSFIAPTYDTLGSLEIKGKTNSKYIGNVTITINKLEKTNLNTLELNTTAIPGTANMSQEVAFQAFLETNENILGDTLTLDQVELSNFQTVQILQNGSLTITIKEGINSKYTGSINVTLKYTLDYISLTDAIDYLSKNNMLNFEIPTGTNSDELFNVIVDQFKKSFDYIYGKNVVNFSLGSSSNLPTQEQLNTKGYIWKPWREGPAGNKVSDLMLLVNMLYTDGHVFGRWFFGIICTVTMV